MSRIEPITLVIVDTGPLISLAVIDRLDLLQWFGTPIFVTDAVMYECIALPESPGADRLRDWFERGGGNQHRIISTPIGAAYRDAKKFVDQGHSEATKNFGEWATSWALNNLEALLGQLKLNPSPHFGLILSEDKNFLNNQHAHAPVPDRTYVLSTRAFFIALQALGAIPNAESVRDQIKKSGRPNLSKAIIDRPYEESDFHTDYQTRVSELADQNKKVEAESDTIDIPAYVKPPGQN